jgi:hypothetical protein
MLRRRWSFLMYISWICNGDGFAVEKWRSLLSRGLDLTKASEILSPLVGNVRR